ncbi:MAG: 2-phosphosulfolactate phosphatase [Pseudomonadota bacterium]
MADGANVQIWQGHRPKLRPGGLTIVIDLLRAFTTTHYAILNGAYDIILVGSIEEARSLKVANKDSVLLAGERCAVPIEGFDFGNSPAEINRHRKLLNKTLVLTTTNGVTAALHEMQSGDVVLTGFSNSYGTIEYVGQSLPASGVVNIVASHPTGDDDMACAEYLRSMLLGENPNLDDTQARILNCEAAQKSADPDQPQFDPEDLALAASPKNSRFAMLAARTSTVNVKKAPVKTS